MKKFPSSWNGTPVPYTATFEELSMNVETPGPLAWASCIALGHMENSAALQKLVELAKSADWRYRRSAIEAVAYHSQEKTAIGTIQIALHDSSSYVVRSACQTVGTLHLLEAHNDVLALLESQEPYTREIAVGSLSEIWQLSDFDTVYTRLLHLKN